IETYVRQLVPKILADSSKQPATLSGQVCQVGQARDSDQGDSQLSLVGLLQKHFGFASFRPHQEEVCQQVVAGFDLLVVMPTGAGKSLCYQIPGLARPGTSLIISPLIALMED